MQQSLRTFIAILSLSCWFVFQAAAQTTLAAGDIAIIRVNTDDADQFVFVLLKAVEANTKIRFTDQGWRSADGGTFQTNTENHLEWTAPVGGLAAGKVITITEATDGTNAGGGTPSTFSVTPLGTGSALHISGGNNFSLSNNGDQVFAYQGTAANPTFLFAVQSNSKKWQGNPNNNATSESALPAGLTNGVNAVAAGAGTGAGDEYDNIQFNFSVTSGTPAEILAAIANVANWVGQNSPRYTAAISDFTITPLPVEWLGFEARVQGQQVALEWITASELNNDFFAVERSLDGRSYAQIGTVRGAGTTQEIREYSFTDLAPTSGANYYRIRQVDFDGAFDFSDVVSVELALENIAIRLYPNPVQDQLFVESQAGDLKLYTITGQQLFHIKLAPGRTAVDMSQFNAGVYIVEIKGDNGTKTVRRIVK